MALGNALLGFGIVVGLWWLVASTEWAGTRPQVLWLAHPRDVFSSALNLSSEGWASIVSSALRLIPGVGMVLAIGVPAGVFLGYALPLFRVLESPLDFWRSIPPLAVLPICFFLFVDTGEPWAFGMLDTGDRARAASVVFGCLPIVVFLIADAVRSIPPARLAYARRVGATPWFQLRHVLTPELLPVIFLSMRTVVSFGVVIIVAGEMAWGAGLGLGDRINETRYAENGLPASYVFAIASGLIGYVFNLALRLLEKGYTRWPQHG